jgi:hypothetical protein
MIISLLDKKEQYKSENNNKLQNNKVIKYLQGCQFIFDLYFLNNIRNYKWFYPFEKSPSLKELKIFFRNNNNYEEIFNYMENNNNDKYLTMETYIRYIEDNKSKILSDISIRIDPNITEY